VESNVIEHGQDAGISPGAQHSPSGKQRRKWRSSALSPVLAVSLAAGTAVAGTLGGAATAGASTTASSHTARAALPRAAGKTETMIVFLRGGSSASSKVAAASASASQAAVVSELRTAGAKVVATTSFLNTVIAKMTPAEAAGLRSQPGVTQVIPSSTIRLAALPSSRDMLPAGAGSVHGTSRSSKAPGPCGTAAKPEQDPEALGNINYAGAAALKIDGAGVNVGIMAGGIDPANVDMQRNSAYASAGSPAHSHVITQNVDFGGDGTGKPSGDAAAEAWGDASSIAAQGNVPYDLSKFVNTAHPLPSGCDIKITGDAPGANIVNLEIFATNNLSTTSGLLQAIQYAVAHGVKVLNQSFGNNGVPDLSLDVIRRADEAAVAAGVTVVVSTGDAGLTNTQGSPSTDPAVIGAGATTTFRSYAQETFGGINWPGWKGTWVDNNLSSISSSGFAQNGRTVDIVAPGDSGWALCEANATMFPFCTNENGSPSAIQDFGGTSQACPFVSGAAADVIQAYRQTHKGAYPTPALVAQILESSATDISGPANQQGAGLLNIGAAVKLAESIPGTTAKPAGGLLIGPNQINFSGTPKSSQSQTIKVTNTGSTTEKVTLSTRALASKPATTTGVKTFCMNPAAVAKSGCPVNSGSFPIWSGVTEVYQNESFTVPAGSARLSLSADFQFTGQASLLHFALFAPNGAYAGYSLPQGLGDYGNVEVANPQAGAWTAVFFTEKGGPGTGTSGPIQWQATTWKYVSGGTITPSSLSIPAGKSANATLKLTAPSAAGDSSQSVIVKSASGTNTIPVTVRTLVGLTSAGGSFSGNLTGGNGRGGGPGQENTYGFVLPAGKPSLNVTIHLASNPAAPIVLGDQLTAYLVDPTGQTVGYSSNYTTTSGGAAKVVGFVSLYHANPMAGQWRVMLSWANPVTGKALSVPFTGSINFTALHLSSNTVPNSSAATIKSGVATPFKIDVCNPSAAPQAFFVDPRQPFSSEYPLANIFGTTQSQVLGATNLPNSQLAYIVPPDTTEIAANIAGTLPVTFDTSYFPGDPDLSPGISEPGVSGSQSGNEAALTYTNAEISPGAWALVPDEVGPYGTTGYKTGQAQVNFSVLTQAFDPTVTSSTGDMWENGTLETSSTGTPLYLTPAGSSSTTNCGIITVTIKPTAAVGTVVSGTLYVDDSVLGSNLTSGTLAQILPNGDQMLAVPYKYKVN
jgi:hypothetical protein